MTARPLSWYCVALLRLSLASSTQGPLQPSDHENLDTSIGALGEVVQVTHQANPFLHGELMQAAAAAAAVCWVRMPTGCDISLDETEEPTQWFKDDAPTNWNWATCHGRVGWFNFHCGRSDAVVHWAVQAPGAQPANYLFGDLGSNDCPCGYANVVTIAGCRAAHGPLGLSDKTGSNEAHLQNVRPKGCFEYGSAVYWNPNTGMPSSPDMCCKPVCVLTATNPNSLPSATLSCSGSQGCPAPPWSGVNAANKPIPVYSDFGKYACPVWPPVTGSTVVGCPCEGTACANFWACVKVALCAATQTQQDACDKVEARQANGAEQGTCYELLQPCFAWEQQCHWNITCEKNYFPSYGVQCSTSLQEAQRGKRTMQAGNYSGKLTMQAGKKSRKALMSRSTRKKTAGIALTETSHTEDYTASLSETDYTQTLIPSTISEQEKQSWETSSLDESVLPKPCSCGLN